MWAAWSLADSADHAEECSMAVLFRRERQFGVSVVLGFVCVNLRDLREIHGVSLMIDWVFLREYSPADYADHAEEYSKLYYFAEKDCLELMWFGGSSAIISEICGRFIGVLCAIIWVLLCEELTTSQIYHISNGRSHGNVVQTRAESSSLLECNAECRRHSWNEIQKQRFSLSHEQRKLAYYAMMRNILQASAESS